MPVYEYKCTACDQHMDVEQSFADDALTVLPGCDVDGSGEHQLKKVFSAVGISFKGDGFYRNDARPGSKSSSSSTASTSSSGDSSSDKSTSSSSSTDSSTSTSSSESSSKSSSGSSDSSGSSGSSPSSSSAAAST